MTFELTGTGGILGRMTVTEQVLEEENRSLLTCTLELTSSQWYGVTYWLHGSAMGREFSSNEDSVYIEKRGSYAALEPWTISVPHNADGSGTVTLTLKLNGYTASGGSGSGWLLQGSRTVTLTPIARASEIRVTDGDIGQQVQISILRKKESYTHKLQYRFGSVFGELDPGSETNLSFLLPEEFYYEIPDSPTGLCRMVCTTFDGERQVGAPAETVFTVRAANCAPILECTAQDVNENTLALTGDQTVVIPFASNMYCHGTATAQKGATIVSLTVNDAPVPVTFEGAQDGKFTFRALDSRGYVTEQVIQGKTVPYRMPTVYGWCSRPDGSGSARLTIQGSCFSGSFGVAENALTIKITANGADYDLTPEYRMGGYSAACTLTGLSYKTAHTIQIRVSDLLGSAEMTVLVERGQPVFDWGSGDFAFHVPVFAPRINGIKNPALKAWPVGAVMLTGGISPASFIGGKWQLYDLPGLPLVGWQRVQGADTLGNALLGEMVLGTEE